MTTAELTEWPGEIEDTEASPEDYAELDEMLNSEEWEMPELEIRRYGRYDESTPRLLASTAWAVVCLVGRRVRQR